MISTQIRHLTAALRTLRYYILLSGGRVMASVIVGFAGNKSRNSADIHHRPITMLSSDPSVTLTTLISLYRYPDE